jgi:UPF0755 protein
LAKKLKDDIYLNHQDEPESRRILLDTQNPRESYRHQPDSYRDKPHVWILLRPVVITVISLALVVCSLFYGYNYFKDKYFTPVDPGNNTAIEITIPPAASLTTIADILYNHKVIRDKNVFKLYTDFSDQSYKLKAGTYELSKNMSFDDIIYTLMKGQAAQVTTNVTLTEGMILETMGQTLVNKGALEDDTQYLALCKNGTQFSGYTFLADALANAKDRKYVLEGYMFPDTYEFFANSDVNVIIQKQLDRFDQIFTDDYETKAHQMNMTIDQVITLASIIEKEGKPQDFAKISAVFHNRLDKKMKLQSDATLMYALGIKKYNYTDAQKQVNSPYNTYNVSGLPIGPICNPGKNAIDAALNPDPSFVQQGYLYFTLTDPNSNTLAFSKTLQDHNAVVSQYQQSWIDADNAAASASAKPSASASK